MNAEEARRIISGGEGQHSEFKRTFAEENEAIKSLCAFTHAEGGTVFFGVANNGEMVGTSVGQNTLENFANKLQSNTNPPLTPSVEQLTLDGKPIVTATIKQAKEGQLFYAFNVPYIRVGKTNQVMSPDQQRVRLQSADARWSEERDRPTFEVTGRAVTNKDVSFEPAFRLKQASGEYVANLEWRFRGPRFQMDWGQAGGHSLERTHISAEFDKTATPVEDELVDLDELALEIRFHWRGHWWFELHSWPITIRAMTSGKTHWDVGREKIPPLRWQYSVHLNSS